MNARNLLYIKPFNPRKAVAFADDKLRTKAFLSARDVPVAKMYARIEDHTQLRTFDFAQLPDECVLKPNYGFGGGGIKVLKRKKNSSGTGGEFLEQGKRPISDRELREHIEDILDGKFSVNGLPDTAFFEKILVADPGFAPFRPAGLPDVRIIVFNLVPVMAMLRIPTAESGGKANVHMGGIGIGIDIAKGVTTYATQYNKRMTELPHGGSPSGIAIPRWEELLLTASKIQYVTNIGYIAVDLTLDAEQGPVLLEVNARAGLMVQVANLAPLRSRLERVAGLSVQSPEKGVRLAQELFGAKRPVKKDASDSEKPVLGMRETILVTGSGSTLEVPTLISPDHERTIFSHGLIKELKTVGAVESENPEEGTFRVKFSLGGKKLQTVVREGEVSPASVRALLGRRDLTGFLIDPSRTVAVPTIRPTVKEDFRAVDRVLAAADEELMLLKHIKPQNLNEEWEKARLDPSYNPMFQYAVTGFNIDDLESRLKALTIDDSPVGVLFNKKRRELLHRAALLRARGDSRRFTEASSLLFGTPSSVLLTSAMSVMRSRDSAAATAETPGTQLTADETAKIFEEVLTKYGLHDWQVTVKENTIARCTVGGKKVTLRKEATFTKEILDALIAHEIETHVITAENGDHQPYELFRRGFANYLDTQEGLAIYNQNRFLTEKDEKRFGPVRNILSTAFALEHSFADTRKYLIEELGYNDQKALSQSIAVKRGLGDTSEPGGFTKGVVYYRGQRAIEQFLAQGGDLVRLYIGKIALEDLELLEGIPGIKKPLVLPNFLREPVPEAKKGKKK